MICVILNEVKNLPIVGTGQCLVLNPIWERIIFFENPENVSIFRKDKALPCPYSRGTNRTPWAVLFCAAGA